MSEPSTVDVCGILNFLENLEWKMLISHESTFKGSTDIFCKVKLPASSFGPRKHLVTFQTRHLGGLSGHPRHFLYRPWDGGFPGCIVAISSESSEIPRKTVDHAGSVIGVCMGKFMHGLGLGFWWKILLMDKDLIKQCRVDWRKWVGALLITVYMSMILFGHWKQPFSCLTCVCPHKFSFIIILPLPFSQQFGTSKGLWACHVYLQKKH